MREELTEIEQFLFLGVIYKSDKDILKDKEKAETPQKDIFAQQGGYKIFDKIRNKRFFES